MDTVTGLSGSVLFAVTGIYILAGLVKGTLGIGLPTAGISLTAQIADARTAIALVIMPMLITNIWQIWRTREHTHRALKFWPLALTMIISIVAFATLAPQISIRWVTLFLGLTVLVFSVVSLLRDIPALHQKFDTSAQLSSGLLAGVMGGITGVWAPPIVIYMSAVRVDKTTFVAVVGVLLMLGSLMLAITYSSVGLITQNQAIASALLVIPSIVGFSLGERIRNRLNEALFKRLVLWFFLLMGLNLVRKSLQIGAF